MSNWGSEKCHRKRGASYCVTVSGEPCTNINLLTVMPNPGVPPAEVLQKLVPHESLRDLAHWSEVKFNDTKEALKRQRAGRRENLAIWDSGNMAGLVVNKDNDTKYEMPKIKVRILIQRE